MLIFVRTIPDILLLIHFDILLNTLLLNVRALFVQFVHSMKLSLVFSIDVRIVDISFDIVSWYYSDLLLILYI